MRKLQKYSGTVCMKITCAEPFGLVQRLLENGIILFDIQRLDMLTIFIRVSAKDFRKTCALLNGKTCRYHIISREGAYWLFRSAMKRSVLIIGLLLLLFATLFIPTRILFVNVEGNKDIPERYILECIKECGITFGASRRQLRSEKIKNSLLDAIPELQWAGINTSGCVATIQVKEKNLSKQRVIPSGISNIVAERDGIIYSCTVEEGNQLCKVGQAVKEGQILVSGYYDTGLVVTGKEVKADIFALTQRTAETITPCSYQKREEETSRAVQYSLRIGKNIIKLWKDSGIYDSTCVKMYSEEYMYLPGGFRLPIAFITERIICNAFSASRESELQYFTWLEDYSEDYFLQHMVAGQIMHANYTTEINNEVCLKKLQYACIEMIGKIKTEEIFSYYGENE